MGSSRNSAFEKNSFGVLLICCIIISVQSLNEEGIVLLEFKNSLRDPNGNLQSWNPCNWTGIGCSDNYKVPFLLILHLVRVEVLDLCSNSFHCKFPNKLYKITSLSFIFVTTTFLEKSHRKFEI